MFSEKVIQNLSKGSFIRAMFQQGAKLAEERGAENVYDFSLGNPYMEPPGEIVDYMINILGQEKGLHKYMDNAGFKDVRQIVAKSLREESKTEIGYENVIMTVGAAGGLNVVLKALLNPGEEVIVFAPYFMEYNFYVDNHGGKVVSVLPSSESLEPDLDALKNALSDKTKAIIINNPNNPSGVIYSKEILKDIEDILSSKEKETGNPIYVISDQPYGDIVYEGKKVECQMSIFKNSIIVNSYSKSLGLAGERIGYIAVSSKINEAELLLQALSFCNRTLGFVNAPALFQRAVAEAISLGVKVNVKEYELRRDYLFDKLTELGIEMIKPMGAFYMFPRSPIEDDVEFINMAVKHGILLVPGSGFGLPGYFRLSYCVTMDMIERSIPAFKALMEEVNTLKESYKK